MRERERETMPNRELSIIALIGGRVIREYNQESILVYSLAHNSDGGGGGLKDKEGSKVGPNGKQNTLIAKNRRIGRQEENEISTE